MKSPGNNPGQARVLERQRDPTWAQRQSCLTLYFPQDDNLSPWDTELDLFDLSATLHEPRAVHAVGAGGFLANPSFFYHNKIAPLVRGHHSGGKGTRAKELGDKIWFCLWLVRKLY